ncbi:hypothetical protein A2U01_0030384, partial [Trifolium medium]|nr:hypothetical protein [Trifolium medium]
SVRSRMAGIVLQICCGKFSAAAGYELDKTTEKLVTLQLFRPVLAAVLETPLANLLMKF